MCKLWFCCDVVINIVAFKEGQRNEGILTTSKPGLWVILIALGGGDSWCWTAGVEAFLLPGGLPIWSVEPLLHWKILVSQAHFTGYFIGSWLGGQLGSGIGYSSPPASALMSSPSPLLQAEIPAKRKRSRSITKQEEDKAREGGRGLVAKEKGLFQSLWYQKARRTGWMEGGWVIIVSDKGPFTHMVQNWLKPGWRAGSGMLMRQERQLRERPWKPQRESTLIMWGSLSTHPSLSGSQTFLSFSKNINFLPASVLHKTFEGRGVFTQGGFSF